MKITFYLYCVFFLVSNLFAQDKAFDQASQNRTFTFPRDHGSHNSFETEWWYFTGHLFTSDSKIFEDPSDFGFQLVFFRKALLNSPENRWTQTYLAHGAISDFKNNKFFHDSLAARSGLNLAGAREDKLLVWNRTWKAEDAGDHITLQYELKNGKKLKLKAYPQKGVMLQGDKGLSAKGTCAGCASYYYSMPRLKLEGLLEYEGQKIEVKGIGWMDHEFMSKYLGKEYVGWDWISLVSKDGWDLMLFRLRGVDRKADFYTASLQTASGQTVPLKDNEFKMEEVGYWKSPNTEANYPITWRLEVPRVGLNERFTVRINDQEIHQVGEGSQAPRYYEGAFQNPSGSIFGYLEMTGYGQPLSQNF